MSGVGGALSSLFGGQSSYQSNIAAPDQNLFKDRDQATNRIMLQNALAQSQGPQAPTVGYHGAQGADMGQQDQSRGLQLNLANQLQQQAAGQGPSLAGQQLQQGLQQQLLQQRAQAASMGGDVNPFLAQRQLGDQAAQAQQATNAQMAMARTQEQMNAQGALAGLSGQLRGQDQNLAQMQQQFGLQNAQLYQQSDLANQGARLQQQGINNQASQYAMSNLLGQSAQEQQAGIAYANALGQRDMANNQINAGIAGQNAQSANAYGTAIFGGLAQGGSAALGGLALGGGGGALKSDERAKTNVDRAGVDKDMQEFLSALDPASYDYKQPEKDGAGRHWSVMAQSAAKTAAGRSFVEETPEGLALDTRKATGVALTALAHLHRRQDKLESLAQKALRRG
jgi:hypothetical protein